MRSIEQRIHINKSVLIDSKPVRQWLDYVVGILTPKCLYFGPANGVEKQFRLKKKSDVDYALNE